MSILTRGLAVFVLLFVCTSTFVKAAEDEEETLETVKVIIDPSTNKSIVQATLFATDRGSYPYAICEWTKPNTEKTCQVKLVGNKPKTDLVCDNVRVYTDDPDKQLFFNGYFQISPFSKDHVVLGWWDVPKSNVTGKKSNIKFSIVNMVTCQTPTIDLPSDKLGYGVFPDLLYYPNQVDIIIYNKDACNGTDKCRLSYDLNGNQIGNASPYNPELIGYASPVNPADTNKGFFENVQLEKSMSVLLVQANGDGKILSTDVYEPEASKQRIAFNNANEKYTSCRMPDLKGRHPTDVYCNLFDSTGNTILNRTLTFPEITHWIAVRSLPDESFLIATAGCDIAISSVNCPDFRVWRATNITGSLYYPTRISGPRLSCEDQSTDLQVRITEDEQSRFCFEFSCLKNNSDLTYVKKCVPRNVLIRS